MRTIEEIEGMAAGLDVKDKAAYIIQEYSKARIKELELIEVITHREEKEESIPAGNNFSKSVGPIRVSFRRNGDENSNVVLCVKDGHIVKSAKFNYDWDFVREVDRIARTTRGLEAYAKQHKIKLPKLKNVQTKPAKPVFVKA